jgi:hypothetical protein
LDFVAFLGDVTVQALLKVIECELF